jgi:hypothetical protein
MIEILIGVLLAISTNAACDYGKPADYYAWMDKHESYHVMDLSTPEHGDIWLISDRDHFDGYYLFKFKKPIAETIGSGEDHGECFRFVGKG